MIRTPHALPGVVAIAALLLSAYAAPAASATVQALYRSSAAGICQSSYPATAGALMRARPLALQNEGSSTGFVTCAFPTFGVGEGPGWPGLGLVFVNLTESSVAVTCTLVSGFTRDGPVDYLPKTAVVPAGSVDTFMMFLPTELPGQPATIPSPNISCALPPNVGIQYLWYYGDRQVGQ